MTGKINSTHIPTIVQSRALVTYAHPFTLHNANSLFSLMYHKLFSVALMIRL
jgi:hypothetical protein